MSFSKSSSIPKGSHLRASRIADLHWIRPPRQARSRQTFERLLDAAEEVIGEKGFEDAGVAEIAARAGLSVGAVYQRFRDKQALIQALLDRGAIEFRATLEAAVAESRWEGASIREILEGYLTFTLKAAKERLGLRRAQLGSALRDPASGQRLVEQHRELYVRLRALLLSRSGEIGHRDPELAIRFVLEQLRAMLLVRLEGAHLYSSLTAVSDERFTSEALKSVAAYLQLASGEAEDTK